MIKPEQPPQPEPPSGEPVRYTKMVLNQNPVDHLVAELKKAYAYIDQLEGQLKPGRPEQPDRPDTPPGWRPPIAVPDAAEEAEDRWDPQRQQT